MQWTLHASYWITLVWAGFRPLSLIHAANKMHVLYLVIVPALSIFQSDTWTLSVKCRPVIVLLFTSSSRSTTSFIPSCATVKQPFTDFGVRSLSTESIDCIIKFFLLLNHHWTSPFFNKLRLTRRSSDCSYCKPLQVRYHRGNISATGRYCHTLDVRKQ